MNPKFNGTNETLSEWSSSKTKDGNNKRVNENSTENNFSQCCKCDLNFHNLCCVINFKIRSYFHNIANDYIITIA